MRVALVGWAEGLACGVSDYTQRLGSALAAAGLEVILWDWRTWRVGAIAAAVRDLRSRRPDLVHLQYPASVYRRTLSPLFVFGGGTWARVATIHEFSQSHPLRRAAACALAAMSHGVVFTTAAELAACRRVWPLVRRKATVNIPIGVTLASLSCSSNAAEEGIREAPVIVYFGLIRPKKGLEVFLEVARRAAQTWPSATFAIIGRTAPGWEIYERQLRAKVDKMDHVVWVGGATEEEVADWMKRAAAVYLPYPDGLSERRSSLLAALAAGVPVVTTPGSGAPSELERAVLTARGVEEALAALRRVAEDVALRAKLLEAGGKVVARRDWSMIAQKHVAFYEEVLRRRRQSK